MTQPILDIATVADIGKGKIVDLLTAQAQAATVGQALYGVSVRYEYDGNMPARCIYGGGWTTSEEEAAGERGALVAELVTCTFYIRVVEGPPAVSVRETDAACAAILSAVKRTMLTHPTLDGVVNWVDMPRKQGDYESHPEQTVSLWGFTTRYGAFLGRSV